MLTSIKSPKVRYFDQLKIKKSRKITGKFMVEGIHLVSEAMNAGMLDSVIYSEKIMSTFEGKNLLGRLISSDIPHEEVSDKVIKHLSEVETPQGIIASVKPRISDLGSLFEEDKPLIVVACCIQDPGNLGTIIRTAVAAGCAGLVISQGSVDQYNDKVIRASAGAIFHLNIVKIDDIIELISALKRRGVKIISSVPGSEKSYYSVNYDCPAALIIGNESQGLPTDVEKLSDELVSIPMKEGIESLNAAVSGAVLLYEAVRQRSFNAG